MLYRKIIDERFIFKVLRSKAWEILVKEFVHEFIRIIGERIHLKDLITKVLDDNVGEMLLYLTKEDKNLIGKIEKSKNQVFIDEFREKFEKPVKMLSKDLLQFLKTNISPKQKEIFNELINKQIEDGEAFDDLFSKESKITKDLKKEFIKTFSSKHVDDDAFKEVLQTLLPEYFFEDLCKKLDSDDICTKMILLESQFFGVTLIKKDVKKFVTYISKIGLNKRYAFSAEERDIFLECLKVVLQ